jgi:hypothetical protein
MRQPLNLLPLLFIDSQNNSTLSLSHTLSGAHFLTLSGAHFLTFSPFLFFTLSPFHLPYPRLSQHLTSSPTSLYYYLSYLPLASLSLSHSLSLSVSLSISTLTLFTQPLFHYFLTLSLSLSSPLGSDTHALLPTCSLHLPPSIASSASPSFSIVVSLSFLCRTFSPSSLFWRVLSGNTKGGSITVLLTSCLTGFGLVCFANKNKNCHLS